MASNKPTQVARPVTPRSVSPSKGIQLIRVLIKNAEDVLNTTAFITGSEVDVWNTLARDYLARAFGSDSSHISSVMSAGSGPLVINASPRQLSERYRESFHAKIKLLEVCIQLLQTDIELKDDGNEVAATPATTPKPAEPPSKVFLVHGHDDGLKQGVARVLEKLGITVVILHEQPNAGRTIIEKFRDHADVQFAVVLATADDLGKAKSDLELRKRARQNVILELGYFLGRLSPAHVCTLYEDGVELPSDYQGVLFLPLDGVGAWKFLLAKELKEAGFKVDMNGI